MCAPAWCRDTMRRAIGCTNGMWRSTQPFEQRHDAFERGIDRAANCGGALTWDEAPRHLIRERDLVSSAELVQGDGQGAHALAGGVIYGVGDRRRHTDDADLAYALQPQRIAVVVLVDEDHPDVVHV